LEIFKNMGNKGSSYNWFIAIILGRVI
jgi:hypothetical protein